MNLNELNAIAGNIRNTDNLTRKTDITPTILYCIAKHNETISILREVYGFVEKNLDLFDNPSIRWNAKSRNEQYHENFQIGNSNPYNCVIRDFHRERNDAKGTRVYWVDEGVIFRVGADGRVQYLTDCDRAKHHGYEPNIRIWNDSYDFTQFNYGVGHKTSTNVKYDYEFAPNWDCEAWSEERFDFAAYDEFSVVKFKEAIDNDFAHAEKVLERLTFTLKKINESVMARQSTLNAALDGSVPKVAKYTIEITKTEN